MGEEIIMSSISEKEVKRYIRFSDILLPEGSADHNIVLSEAEGNGMLAAGIHNGDILMFDFDLEPRNGDIVMANIDNKMVCRRILINNGVTEFKREDDVSPPYSVSDYTVRGVLIGIIRMGRYAYLD